MKNNLAKGVLIALVLVLLAVGQAACGGDSYSSPTQPSNTAPGTTPTPPPGY